MRRSVLLCRGAKGRGWYKRFMEMGEVGFQKNIPPAPFDWSRTLPSRDQVSNRVVFAEEVEEDNASGNWNGPPAPNRPKAFFDMAIEAEAIGRIVVEVSRGLLLVLLCAAPVSLTVTVPPHCLVCLRPCLMLSFVCCCCLFSAGS